MVGMGNVTIDTKTEHNLRVRRANMKNATVRRFLKPIVAIIVTIAIFVCSSPGLFVVPINCHISLL